MTDSTTQERTHADEGAVEPIRNRGFLSMLAGALGVVAAVLPRLGVVALVLAAVAIAAGIPAMRRGPGAPCFSSARAGVVLGMIAVLLGFVSLAMQLLT